jgi:hypothetical protein
MSRSALTTLIVIIAIIVIGGVVIASMRPPGVVAPGQTVAPSPTVSGGEPVTACTLDAKICPDGSAVGRIPPTCEFAACPAPQTTPTPKPSVSTSVQSTTTVQVGLNQKVTVNSLSFTPVSKIAVVPLELCVSRQEPSVYVPPYWFPVHHHPRLYLYSILLKR